MEQEASKPDNQVLPSPSMEEMIEQSIGRVNCAQIIQAVLASIPLLFDSQQTFISVFAQAEPNWHCTKTSMTSSCTSRSNICNLSKTEWAWDSVTTHTSIISEWDLQCASSFIAGLPTTCYFVGCLLGGLALASLGDSSLGRKNLLYGSAIFMSLAALAASFSPDLWVYSGLRFLSGIGRAPIAISTLVLLTERVGKRWRGQMAMVGFICFSLGILVLTGIAYATRNMSWRVLYLLTSIPGIVCCLVAYFFLYESPRWLFLRGRESDAFNILNKIGSASKNQVLPSATPETFTPQKTPPTSPNPFTSLKVLVKRRWAIKRLLASIVVGVGIGVTYFGMFLGVGNLGFNIYLTSAFNSLLSLLSYLITFLFWIQRCDRRSSLLGFCIIGGATSIAFSVLHGAHEGVLIALELVSLFSACMAYNVILMYTVEMFPTCIRNSASSFVRQSMMLGSVFAPILNLLGGKNRLYSYGIFGFAMLLGGFLVLLLPETRGKVLCDTMEEQELRDGENRSNV